jgi:hypothetical protein
MFCLVFQKQNGEFWSFEAFFLFLFHFIKKIMRARPLLLEVNARTMHIKSIVHNSIATCVSLKPENGIRT